MWTSGVNALWRAAYRRAVRSAFATVPLYRERWALGGRTDPVVVPGRTGTHGGAITAEEAVRKVVDLVPLAGGAASPDPARGLGHVLPLARPPRPGTLVVVVDPAIPRPPTDLPNTLRGCVLDPASLTGGTRPAALDEVVTALRRNGNVTAVGPDEAIAALVAALPEDLAHRVDRLPHRALDRLDGGPFGLIHDPVLGYLGGIGHCGRWHLDWPRVYARRTTGGLALTLLRQSSPRLVDILVAGGVRGEVAPCPRHGTPVVLT
ncbi:hypothetical protein [Goodfellowiella coeruleoviolacea]|uniref:Uncharacterized protein n=1 Tax=Goodfellowiella coeruleoviolacea TaxID=334858 RepID=A0AAE3GNY6_9PSEU|nr:hypothetical protein [Goodfellowiella coeruleoviolacea]MCP2169513.1 hypothetical protein [Goodfellowiella coeruleoviolacea]